METFKFHHSQQLHQEMEKRTTSVTNLRLSISKTTTTTKNAVFYYYGRYSLFSLFIFISCVTTSPPLQRVFTFEMENTNTQQIWNTRRSCGTLPHVTCMDMVYTHTHTQSRWRDDVASLFCRTRMTRLPKPISLTAYSYDHKNKLNCQHTHRPPFLSQAIWSKTKQERLGWQDSTNSLIGIHISQIYWLYESVSILLPTISSGSLDEPERE
jgi:hypothetical protein